LLNNTGMEEIGLNDILPWVLLAICAVNLLAWVWWALRNGAGGAAQAAQQTLFQQSRVELLATVQSSAERLERELRREISESSRTGRQELAQNLSTFQQTLVQQGGEATRTQNTQIDAFGH